MRFIKTFGFGLLVCAGLVALMLFFLAVRMLILYPFILLYGEFGVWGVYLVFAIPAYLWIVYGAGRLALDDSPDG